MLFAGSGRFTKEVLVKISTVLYMLMLIMTASASAAPFAPTPLKLSAPAQVSYLFDGSELRIPVTVTGAPADVILSVFTRNCGPFIDPASSGYLGWHYVDRIDTCLYISPAYRFQKGSNTVIWDGRYPGGRIVQRYSCAFYLWGYDPGSPGVKAVRTPDPRRFASAFTQTFSHDGEPLANPILFEGLPVPSKTSEPARVVRGRWIIGGDPNDSYFLETTAYLSRNEAPRLALSPRERDRFFTFTAEPGAATLRKWEWTPNGDALPVAAWGENGEVTYPSWEYTHAPLYGLPLTGGPVSDGADMLYFPSMWPLDKEGRIPEMDSGIVGVNAGDGGLVRKMLIPDWNSPPDAVTCPDFVEYGDGMLFVSSPYSCLVQMIDPAAESETGPVRWKNGLGDGVWDKSLPSDFPRQTYACFGSDAPPNPANIALDVNRFALFPATGLGKASFGVFAPDGSGLGYFPVPGLADGEIYGLQTIDTGSAFDGILYSGTSAEDDSAGVWFRAYDSTKGVIYMPGDDFGQWTPSTPRVSVKSPMDGDVLIPGSERSIVWDAEGVDAIRIKLSPDGGQTWTTVADSVDASTGKYCWTVPKIGSRECRILITDVRNPNTSSVSMGYFTISGPSGVEENARPLALTVSNFPNPFNPSTAISFTLPAPGRVSLTVYDITGRRVRELVSESLSAGVHTTVWDGKDERGESVASGVYISRLTMGKFSATGKMLLVR